MTIDEIKHLRESEDKVEFKQAAIQYNYNNGRRSVLGYVVALANEGGGKLILGVKENKSQLHNICGSVAWDGAEGKLEQDIYRDLGTRVETEVLYEEDNRVLVIHIKSRPIGKWLVFEDVPLMRVGEELLPMNEELMRSILLEQEGDFSAKPCEGLSIDDLDKDALEAMKRHYSQKQGNDTFLTQTNEQVLVDLELMKAGKLTYAALILLAKKEKLQELLPQSEIRLEYRDNPASIAFDNRHTFLLPYFQLIDELWKVINARNKSKKVQVDSFIIDIHELNNEVVRESINNAVAHRDYTKTSEIVIKQSPDIFSVSSHGGLPLGVTKQNILTVNSTPRNRLLAEVMTKTGLVERSGQGVDKIFYQTLSEGKALPSYDDTDLYRVVVNIPVVVKHPVFALFIRNIQQPLSKEEKLGVHHLITLVKIREHQKLLESEKELMPKLIKVGAVRESDNTILLEQEYTRLVELQEGSDRDKVIAYVKENAPVKMGDILELFSHRLTRRQVNNMVYNLVEDKVLESRGKGKGTTYGMKEQ